jgi:ADP-ribose pyrophosphatase YjhB (NUDIX family)
MRNSKKGNLMHMPEQERTMITFRKAPYKFTYRIGGIALHNQRILCQKSTVYPHSVYWFLPGGRAELGETAEETLSREVQEELGEVAQIGRLLYIIENFFEIEKEHHHEIALYFELHFSANSYLYQDNMLSFLRPDEDQLPMIFDWLPLAELAQSQALRPSFFNKANVLQALPATVQHIVLLNGSKPAIS